MNREDLIRSLIQYAASGKLDPRELQPVLRQLLGEPRPPASFGALLDALGEHPSPEIAAVAETLRGARRRDAVAHHGLASRKRPVPDDLRASLGDLPLDLQPGWVARPSAMGEIQAALKLLGDRFFAEARKDQAPSAAVAVEKKYQEAIALASQAADAWSMPSLNGMVAEVERQAVAGRLDLSAVLPGLKASIDRATKEAVAAAEGAVARPDQPLPPGLDADLYFAAVRAAYGRAATREERRRLLDRAFGWPTDQAASSLQTLPDEPWAEERASLLLALRFGQPGGRPIETWSAWKSWLQVTVAGKGPLVEGSRVIVRKRPLAMLYLWFSRQPDANPEALAALETMVRARLEPVTVHDFVERWAGSMSAAEITALTGVEPAAVQFVDEPKPVAPAPFRETKVEKAAVSTKVLPPKPPPKPSVWDAHLKPFFLENWYMVAGVAMVLVGSSLLAYYTWDKGWLLRYTIMPSLLGAFTMALAWLGGWIERKDATLKGTGAVLRGAAIGLLPINFMAVALLANDADVGVAKYKAVAVPVMGAIYLALFGFGLRKWCAAVHPGLGFPLGGTLLFLNMLVMLAAAAGTVAKANFRPVIGTGFYLGFFALMAAVIWFSRKILNGGLAKEKRVVWFFGAALSVTFLQVFAWVHGYLQYLPKVGTYAPMVVLTGWLVLLMERRTLELRGEADKHGAESFLGFAFILLGVLMGAADPYLRIVTLVLAGAVWICQSLPRRQQLHSWIGLTFIVLGGAAIGLIEGFPTPWLPTLGIALAVGLGAFALLARSNEDLRRAAGGMQAAVLFLSVVVTVVAQERFNSPVLIAAAHLAVISGLFAIRGWRDRKIRWVQTAMVVLALALPYLAGTRLTQQELHSTTLVFGLAVMSVVWIALTLVVKSPLLLGARSTVLWIYGAMAIACMAARTTIDPASIHDPPMFDIGGPLLMTAVLVWASYFSRSLVPSGMAMLIALVLTPELKERLQQTYPHLGWGTGFGSSIAALVLMVGAMLLRRMPSLRDLGDGDKYMGETPYPLLRRNHSLFTLPMVASALFLAVKIETWNLFLRMPATGPSVRMALAVFLSGVVWTLFAVSMRGPRGVQGATYAGLFWMIVGLTIGVDPVMPAADTATVVLVPALFVQALYFGFRFVLEKRCPWAADLLTAPTRYTLRLGSVLIALASMGALLFQKLTPTFGALTAFAALQLAWHGLVSRRQFFGYVLFVLDLATLGSLAQGKGESFLLSSLGLVIGVHAVQAALEFKKPFHEVLKPLLVPFRLASTFVAVCIGIVGLRLSIEDHGFANWQLAMAMIALLLAARTYSSGFLALLGVLVGYVLVESAALDHLPHDTVRWLHLIEPCRAAFLGLTMAVLGHAGSRIHQVHPAVLSSPFATLKWPAAPWMFFPAAVIATLVSIYHTGEASLREAPVQLLAPYGSALTVGVIAFSTRQLLIYHATGVLLTLGNVHLVRVAFGQILINQGVSEVHLVAAGIALTLLQGTVVRRILRKPEADGLINQASLGWAGLILGLIAANYLVHPNLETITVTRFAVSGAMAFLAGWYFRRAARKPSPGEEKVVPICEGLYHFGITIAFWCGALMIPALRNPVAALIALALPVLYFYLRAEDGMRRGVETFHRYRTSAATLGFIVLAMYAFRGILQLVIFPDSKFDTLHYHANSPVIFVLGVVLLRLHALRGTWWLAFYGGLSVMASTYFAVTALPGLSPFQEPAAAAWCAIAVAHFFTIASLQQSPLRTAIQRLAAIDPTGWQGLRRPWGVCLLVAAHGMVLLAVAYYAHHPRMIAPLIVGAATVLIHQGILRQSSLYALLAQIEIAVALHMGFLMDSLLAKEHVVWALLVVWTAMLVAQPIVARLGGRWEMGRRAALLAGLVLIHVFYHGPWTTPGLWAFALGAILLAATPRRTRAPETIAEAAAASVPPLVPAWLVLFSQAPIGAEGFRGLLHAWPALATAGTLLATGALASFFPKGWAEHYAQSTRLGPRLLDQTVTWLGLVGGTVYSRALWVSFLITAAVQAAHWGSLYTAREMVLLEGLWTAFAVAWLFEGRARKSMGAFFLLEVCVLGAYLAGREQFQLTRGTWRNEVDVGASLLIFFILIGVKQLAERQPREVQVPIRSALLALPVFSVAWIMVHHLSTDLGLLAVGLHSAAFAYLGKDDRESPYPLVAIGGFVGFVMMLFWSKLHLTMVYAYVIPVGIGVLVLLQLFKGRVAPEARNGIRAVTVLAMLGSAGWAALVGKDLPLLANFVVMALCLASMAMGGLLHIRMYVALGFGGLIIDLLSLLVKAVVHMPRSIQMTAIGSLVLVMGAGLVFGAIYYKTHRQEIAQWMDRWKLRFAGWE